MSSDRVIETFSPAAVPPHLLTRLNAHLPFSLTVLRRIQVARLKKGGSTPHSHIIYVHHADAADAPAHFAAAFVDLSRGPETECWIYSTLQDAVAPNTDPTSSQALPARLSPGARDVCVDQLLRLLRRMRGIEAAFASSNAHSQEGLNTGHSMGHVRVGALHETVRQALIAAGVGVKATSVVPAGQDWVFYGTWLIRAGDLKAKEEVDLPQGMRWDVLRAEDTGLVQSRTKIPKREYVFRLFRLFRGSGRLSGDLLTGTQ
jgi:hypothetical protein